MKYSKYYQFLLFQWKWSFSSASNIKNNFRSKFPLPLQKRIKTNLASPVRFFDWRCCSIFLLYGPFLLLYRRPAARLRAYVSTLLVYHRPARKNAGERKSSLSGSLSEDIGRAAAKRYCKRVTLGLIRNQDVDLRQGGCIMGFKGAMAPFCGI